MSFNQKCQYWHCFKNFFLIFINIMPSLCVRNYSNDFSLFDSYCIERIWWKQRSLIDVFSMPTTPRRMIRTSNPIRRRRCSKKNDLASRHPRQLAFFFLPFLLVFLLLSLSLSNLFHFSLFFASLIRLSCFFSCYILPV